MIGVAVRAVRPVLNGSSLSVEEGSPTIHGGAGNVEPTNGNGNTEIERILNG